MAESEFEKPNWRFWLVVSVGLVFNLLGCLNFLMQFDPDFVAGLPDFYRRIIDTRPVWETIAFAAAVFGGAAGCVLLLLRKSAAIYVFAVSLVGALLAMVRYFGMDGLPADAWYGWVSQVVMAAFLVWYSRYATRKGWAS